MRCAKLYPFVKQNKSDTNENNNSKIIIKTFRQWKGKDWVILSGLQAGDKVIIDNLIKVRPGMPVTNMPSFKK